MPQQSHVFKVAKEAAKEPNDVAVENAQAVGDSVSRVVSDAVEAAREKATELTEGGLAAAAKIGEQVSDNVKAHASLSLLIAAFIVFALIFGLTMASGRRVLPSNWTVAIISLKFALELGTERRGQTAGWSLREKLGWLF